MADELRIFPDEFVPNVQSSKTYQRWAKSSPGDRGRWEAFRDALLAGQEPSVPSMATTFGRALVAAGKEHMSISALVGLPVPPYPPPGTPPAPPQGTLPLNPPAWTGPLTITSGGTYDGQALGTGWESASPTGAAVLINTTEPVVIKNAWIRNLAGGRCIEHSWGQSAHLTLQGSRLTGGVGRALELDGPRYLLVENCTLEKTSGIRLGPDPSPGSSVVIRYNRHHNIQEETGRWGNFVQLHTGGTNGNSYLIEWNEVENEYNLSKPEDLISIISVRNVTVRNNMLWHNSIPGNPGQGSNGSITAEAAGSGVVCDNITINDNQMVDTATGVYFQDTNNSIAYNNRLVQDGYLPDGVTRIASGWGGFALLVGCVNSHFHNNISGYVNRDGVRNDYDNLAGAPEGHAAESANNSLLPDPITRQMELGEWTLWQSKLSANGITIGA